MKTNKIGFVISQLLMSTIILRIWYESFDEEFGSIMYWGNLLILANTVFLIIIELIVKTIMVFRRRDSHKSIIFFLLAYNVACMMFTMIGAGDEPTQRKIALIALLLPILIPDILLCIYLKLEDLKIIKTRHS